MILVTGATGFVGRVLIRQLVENDHDVRVLIRPSKKTPNIPRGVPVEVVVTSLKDERGLQAAMVGVTAVYHLATEEWRGARADLFGGDIQGTLAIARAAAQARVDRLFMVSHLGADRASAYPALKAKGIAEEHLRNSGVDYTILRTAILFGPGDHFTSGIAKLTRAAPFLFLLPGDGGQILQPLWVEDLVTCMVWALDDPQTRNQTYELGGPEYFSLREMVGYILRTLGVQKKLVNTSPPYLRALTVFLEAIFPGLPVSPFWLDYLATNRSTSLDTIPRIFGLLPSRFPSHIDYLKTTNWRRELWRSLFRRKK